MFCPKCGMKNNDENSWCIRCGNKLDFVFADEKKLDDESVGGGAEVTERREPIYVETEPVTEPKKQYGNGDSSNEPKKIKDHFVWAILSAVFGSVIFGVLAVIFSGLTQSEQSSGNVKKAEEYSSKAKLFCVIATIIGAIKLLSVLLFFVITIAVALFPFYLS